MPRAPSGTNLVREEERREEEDRREEEVQSEGWSCAAFFIRSLLRKVRKTRRTSCPLYPSNHSELP